MRSVSPGGKINTPRAISKGRSGLFHGAFDSVAELRTGIFKCGEYRKRFIGSERKRSVVRVTYDEELGAGEGAGERGRDGGRR